MGALSHGSSHPYKSYSSQRDCIRFERRERHTLTLIFFKKFYVPNFINSTSFLYNILTATYSFHFENSFNLEIIMGKKPFSSKAKREQLRAKRMASSSTVHTNTPTNTSNSQQIVSTTNQHPVSVNSTPPPRRMARERAPRANLSSRYRLQLGSDHTSNRHEQSSDAHIPLSSVSLPETNINDIRPYPISKYNMPRRPPWRYDESVANVDRREMDYLKDWIKTVESTDGNSFFEHNLETWRQLWRVLERSDVIVLVADIRYPALHFVPDLYYYITQETDKGIVLALNKCDLVPLDVLNAWKNYFQQTYPDLAIALFSSFPDSKLAPSDDNSELLSKRERRMARSKLAAWGADQLLAAIETLSVSEEKRAFLAEWRKQLEASDDDDDDDQFVQRPYQRDIYNHYLNGNKQRPLIMDAVEMETGSKKALKKKRRRAKAKARQTRDDVSETLTATTMTTTTGDEADLDDTVEIGHEFDTLKIENEDADVRADMITIGFVGHPNAGKSSLINGIFGKKVVSTSRTPGHTKHLQTIFLSKSVRLCDCPGLVFPAKAPRELQILAGMYPISQVREPYATIKYLAERTGVVEMLGLDQEMNKLEEFTMEKGYFDEGWTAWKICEAWAIKRGFRTARAARLDVFRAANNILRLALDGRIVLATVPQGFVKGQDSGNNNMDRILDVTRDNRTKMMSEETYGKLDKEHEDSDGAIADVETSEIYEESDGYESAVQIGNPFNILDDEM